MQLNDTHLVLLSAAAQDPNRLLAAPAKPGKAADALASRLERAGLVETVAVKADQPHWRVGAAEQPIGLRLLPAGFEALGIVLDEHAARPQDEPVEVRGPASTAASSTRVTRRTQLMEMLGRAEGASIDDMVTAMGWLPHTARAALTGLRKAGHDLLRNKDEAGKTVYRLKLASPAASDSAGASGA